MVHPKQLPRRNDVSPLTDPMFVGRAITALPEQVSRVRGAETGWRGLGSQTAILALS
jgi:type 2A phosphatase activator TIP41